MADQITIFCDYTCPYTYRAHRGMQMALQSNRSIAITCKPLLLKEINRASGAASCFDNAVAMFLQRPMPRSSCTMRRGTARCSTGS